MDRHLAFSVFVPLEPQPASRPIVSRYGTRYGKKHQAYVQQFTDWVAAVQDDLEWQDTGKQLTSVLLTFYSTKAKTSKLTTPRYDVDNAIKLILDCMGNTGLVWHDDKYIKHIEATKRFRDPEEDAGTLFELFIIED